MSRVASHLPFHARSAVHALLERARDHEEAALRARRVVTLARDDAEQTDELANSRHRSDLSALHRRLNLETYTGKTSASNEPREVQTAALQSLHDTARVERWAQIHALREEERVAEGRIREANALYRRLARARDSSEGLAPWDALALDALRTWGDEVPETEGPPMLKGAEAAALVQARLGVSRSMYYERYRRLLRAHHVLPLEVTLYPDNSYAVTQGATMRFRRDEVEAMVRFFDVGMR